MPFDSHPSLAPGAFKPLVPAPAPSPAAPPRHAPGTFTSYAPAAPAPPARPFAPPAGSFAPPPSPFGARPVGTYASPSGVFTPPPSAFAPPVAPGPAATPEAASLEFEFVRRLVRERSAIVLGAEKEHLMEARLAPLARRHGLPSGRALVHQIRLSPPGPLHDQVVEAFTTNETYFFRDGLPFEALRHFLLPDLVARQKATRRLRILSAACSTGQEAYSVAMLLREHFPLLNGWNVEIVGTDLSTEVLVRAREGVYNRIEANRGLDPRLRARYFHEERDGGIRMKDEIRKMVTFQAHNLAVPWPAFPPMDLVMIRNVLIYFDVEMKRAVLREVEKALRPGGYLLLGAAETTLNLSTAFERVDAGGAVCYRRRA